MNKRRLSILLMVLFDTVFYALFAVVVGSFIGWLLIR
jgi:ABC-type antimicrobial peptide transport system permease subunit